MGKYSAAQFIKAIKGSGGVISAIADAVECDWHTAKRYIEEYATVKEAWQNERNRITDRARHNIIKAVSEGDLQMSKWWLQVMDPEFVERNRTEHSGTTTVEVVYVNEDHARATASPPRAAAGGGQRDPL